MREVPIGSTRAAELPLSLGQRRLWALLQQRPHDPAYQHLSVMRLRGPLRIDSLETALQDVVSRHAALRMAFPVKSAKPVVWIEPTALLPLRRLDHRGLEPALQHVALQRIARDEARDPMDTARAPLARAVLLHLGDDEALLLLVAHHLIIDGWSLGLLIEDLSAAYARRCGGGDTEVPRDDYDIADYIREALASTAQRAYRDSVAYWQSQLDGMTWSRLPVVDAAAGEGRGATRRLRFAGLRERLDASARAWRLTRYQVLSAAFVAWLGVRTGNPDVAVATLLANRTQRRHQRVVGYLANTVALRHRCNFSLDPEAFALTVAQTALDLMRHGAVSLFSLAEAGVTAAAARPSILFALQNQPLPPMRIGEVTVEMMDIDVGITKFELSLYLAEVGEGVDLWVEHDLSIFDGETVEAFVDGYRRAIDAFCDPRNAGRAVGYLLREAAPESRLEKEAAGAFEQLAWTWMSRCERGPRDAALRVGARSYQFDEVLQGVQAIRAALSRRGLRPGDRVALLGDRGFGLICAMWACLADGLCYVPLGASMPEARLKQVLAQSAPTVVLRCDVAVYPAATSYGPLLELADCLRETGPAPVLAAQAPQVPAYLIFTSGSTGVPKGVTVTQGNLAAFAQAMDLELPAVEGGEWLAVSNPTFDIAVLETLWAMSRGMCVRIVSLSELAAGGVPPAPAPASGGWPDLGLFFLGSTDQYHEADHVALLASCARFADEQGLAAVWTQERHLSGFGGFFPNPALAAVYLAGRTQRVALRAGSIIGPLHATPRMAEDWALVDRLSGGSAGLSIAAGWNPADFVLSFRSMQQRREVVERQIDDLRALWRGETVLCADAKGRHFAVRTAVPTGHTIPLWLTVSNQTEQFLQAARQRVGVLTHLLEQDVEQLARNIESYREAWRQQWGRDAAPGRVVVMLHTLVADDDAKAEATAVPHLTRYLATAREALRSLAGPAAVTDVQADVRAEREFLEQAALRLVHERSLIGGAQAVRKRLQRLWRLGVDEVACLVDFGLKESDVLGSLRQLLAVRPLPAETVAPPLPTHFQCTPSAARLLLQDGPAAWMEHLRCWAVGGEALDAPLLMKMRSATGAHILNLYGPTEATVWSSAAHVAERRTGPLSIGRPLAGTRLYVLDDRLQPVPQGVAGQLFVAGAGVAQGYWRGPGITAEAFLPDLVVSGERMYATGDCARLNGQGAIEFLGRADRQVKLNGHRLELDSVRKIVALHPEVAEAVVLALPAAESAGVEVVTFIVPRPGAADELVPRLRDHLSAFLEPGSQPAEWMAVNAIPLTPSQKTDEAALVAALQAHRVSAASQALVTASEGPPELATMRELWSRFVPRAADHIHFHRLGGNSLMAMRLLAVVNRHFDVELSLQDFYRKPTLSELTSEVRKARGALSTTPLLRADRETAEHPVSAGQRSMLIVDALGQAPGDSYRVHVTLLITGPLQPAALREAFNALLARHRVFRTGYSFDDGQFVQRLVRDAVCDWEQHEAPVAASELLRGFVDRPFDLRAGRVVRAMLLRHDDAHSTFCLALHHVVSDGSTIRLVLREMLDDYQRVVQDGVADRRPAKWQYIDFCDWQRRHLARREPELRAFWQQHLADLPVQAGTPHARAASAPAGSHAFQLEAAPTLRLEGLVHRLGVGLLSVLLLPLALMEECRAGVGRTLAIATDARNRLCPEFEAVPGMMVNQLLLALRLPEAGTTADALVALQATLLAALSHQEYPFEQVAGLLRDRQSAHAALFDCKLVLNEPADHGGALPDLDILETPLAPRNAKFGLLFNVRREGQTLAAQVTYDVSRHEPDGIEVLCATYAALLADLDEGVPIEELRALARAGLEARRTRQVTERRAATLGLLRSAKRRKTSEAGDD